MKLNVITLCSGYDSQCMALDELKKVHPDFDYDLIAWSEIDKDAIRSHNAIYPQWTDRNEGDMTKIDWSKFSGTSIDLLTYSTPCLTKDSLILTINGYKMLEELNVGDLVLTKSGYFYPIAKKFDNGYSQTLYLNGMGCENIHCTPNHKFYIRTMSRVWDSSSRRYHREFSEPQFKEVKDISKNDYFGIPIIEDSKTRLPIWNGTTLYYGGRETHSNQISPLLTNEHFWYIMGRYVGDGWTRNDINHKSVTICCSERNENSLSSALFKCAINATISRERTCTKYVINSKEIMEFVDRYGHGAINKRIDGETMMLPEYLLRAFIDGCMDSDGCFTQNQYKYSSISRELIYGLAYCINRVYKRHCSVRYTSRKPKVVIEGRECNQQGSYQLTFTKDKRKQDHAFYEDGYIWYPYKNVTPGDVEHVYNIEVNTDHSYIIQGCISKNCTDISNAGQQKGLEEGSGTRSSILWYTRYAIQQLKPKYLLLENVKALVGKKFLPYFHKWLNELDELGYDSYYQVMNAVDYGVAQNRERIFVVSIRRDTFNERKYKFPHPVPLTKTIEDYLEDEVDEKYYLKDEQVQKFITLINKGEDSVSASAKMSEDGEV